MHPADSQVGGSDGRGVYAPQDSGLRGVVSPRTNTTLVFFPWGSWEGSGSREGGTGGGDSAASGEGGSAWGGGARERRLRPPPPPEGKGRRWLARS